MIILVITAALVIIQAGLFLELRAQRAELRARADWCEQRAAALGAKEAAVFRRENALWWAGKSGRPAPPPAERATLAMPRNAR